MIHDSPLITLGEVPPGFRPIDGEEGSQVERLRRVETA